MNGNYRNQQRPEPFSLLEPSSHCSVGKSSNNNTKQQQIVGCLSTPRHQQQQQQQQYQSPMTSQSYSNSNHQLTNGLPPLPAKPKLQAPILNCYRQEESSSSSLNKQIVYGKQVQSLSQNQHQHQLGYKEQMNADINLSCTGNVISKQMSANQLGENIKHSNINSRSIMMNKMGTRENGQQNMSDSYYIESNSDHYANQLRQSQIKHRIGIQATKIISGVQGNSSQLSCKKSQITNNINSNRRQLDDESFMGSQEGSRSEQESRGKSQTLINFNRSNKIKSHESELNSNSNSNTNASSRANSSPVVRLVAGDNENDDEDGEHGRKKKYLTAKYGQQQMNLIKKRLKIEMWLYEQLQELAKGTQFEAELEEIDIDLDQLLDMENDDTRRHWLRKTLEPLEDLAKSKLEKFIEQVLEQSKLL